MVSLSQPTSGGLTLEGAPEWDQTRAAYWWTMPAKSRGYRRTRDESCRADPRRSRVGRDAQRGVSQSANMILVSSSRAVQHITKRTRANDGWRSLYFRSALMHLNASSTVSYLRDAHDEYLLYNVVYDLTGRTRSFYTIKKSASS